MWLFRKKKETQLNESYDNMIAWLNLLRNMYKNECETEKISEQKNDTYVRETEIILTDGVT